jgi:hypothetical protein
MNACGGVVAHEIAAIAGGIAPQPAPPVFGGVLFVGTSTTVSSY